MEFRGIGGKERGLYGEHGLDLRAPKLPRLDVYYQFDNRPCLSRIVIGF
jgi:hypothetical protein